MSDDIRTRAAERCRQLKAERDALGRAILELDALVAMFPEPADEGGVPGNSPAPEIPGLPRSQVESPAAAGGRGAPAGKPGRPRKDWPAVILKAIGRGRLRMAELEAATGASAGASAQTLHPHLRGNPWFTQLVPSNRLSPWVLTAEGTAALAGSFPPG